MPNPTTQKKAPHREAASVILELMLLPQLQPPHAAAKVGCLVGSNHTGVHNVLAGPKLPRLALLCRWW